ncbi:MAG: biotin transporter BioY [Holosporales bacterium]|jgi:biotin transport system substrate-specific component|nr:biotin transporter BioY [Holosporales bacterium]
MLSQCCAGNPVVKGVLVSLLGSAAIALGAQATVPFIPIPFTLQTMALLFVAFTLGPNCGVAAVLLYLLEGIIGIPVFAGFSSGIHVILGPRGGYLLGFIPAVYLSGLYFRKLCNGSFPLVFLGGVIGSFIVLVCGYLHLSFFVGFSKACTLGVVPFCLTDLLKVLVFSVAVVVAKKSRNKTRE